MPQNSDVNHALTAVYAGQNNMAEAQKHSTVARAHGQQSELLALAGNVQLALLGKSDNLAPLANP